MKIDGGGPQPFKLGSIVDLSSRQAMTVNDEYQRGAAWSLEQKQSLIDSLFRGYPLPLFYFREKSTAGLKGEKAVSYEIVDGQQRILAFKEFKTDKWPTLSPKSTKLGLPGSVASEPCGWGERHFSDLTDDLGARFLDAQLQCIVITGATDDEVRDLFIRLQAGTALTRQQVRDAWPGAIGPYIEKLAGKKTKRPRYPNLFDVVGRWGAKATDDEVESEDPYHDDRQTCAQMFLLFLSRERSYTEIPSLVSSGLDDLYHTNISFDVKGPVASRFEELLSHCQEVVGDERGKGKKIRKIELFSLFLFFQDISTPVGSVVSDAVVRTVSQAFWAPHLTEEELEAEPYGRPSSPTDIGNEYRWFSEVKMKNVTVPWLDPVRLFSDEQKEEAWNRAKGVGGLVSCAVCEQVLSREKAQFDHVKPWSRGGPTSVDNCRPLHASCNLLVRPVRSYRH